MFRGSKLFWLTLWVTPLGCTPIVQIGLSNVPAPDPTRVSDAMVRDVVSNGRDSCGRRYAPGPGPLRYQVPPCESTGRTGGTTALAPPVSMNYAMVLRWVEYRHTGWSCRWLSMTVVGGVATCREPSWTH